MKARMLVLIGLALLVAFGTTHLARSWLASQRAALAAQRAKPEKTSTYVLVAAKDLATGSFVRAEDLKWQAWPDVEPNDNYLRKDEGAGKNAVAALSGAVVRSRIAAGEPITKGRVIKPGERGFLAAVLSPGMRAVTVPVTATSDVGGLVFPGDRVDIILSHFIKEARNPNAPARTVSETVLTDLRVLAVDQTTDDKNGKPVLAKTITFEVTPKQAEAVEVANELGRLSLSLRSLAHDGGEDGSASTSVAAVSHTWDSDVSPLLRPEARHADAAAIPVITVLRGASGRGGGGVTRVSASPVVDAGPAAPPAVPPLLPNMASAAARVAR